MSSSSSLKNLPNICKSSQPTLESTSIQIAEPIMKCHTILEMGSHDGSSHTFGSSHLFLEVPQKGFFKVSFGVFLNKMLVPSTVLYCTVHQPLHGLLH